MNIKYILIKDEYLSKLKRGRSNAEYMSGHVDYVISTMYKWWFQCSCRLCQDSDHVQMVVLMFLSKEYTQKVGSTTSIGIIAFDLATRVKRVCRWTSEEEEESDLVCKCSKLLR